MNIELINPNNKDVKEKIIKNAKYIFKHFKDSQPFNIKIRNSNLQKNRLFIYKFNDLKYFDDFLYKMYETRMISMGMYYYNNYLLNDEYKENYIYHLNLLINIVELNIETYKNNHCIINTIDRLREQKNGSFIYLQNLVVENFEDNDIIIYYLNNKFTDIDETIKGNYKTVNNKITVIDETNKANYETLNNKFTDIDETIKDNYETLNNKIIDIKNNYETLNNKIINIEKTIKYNYDILNFKINCVIFIIFIMILI